MPKATKKPHGNESQAKKNSGKTAPASKKTAGVNVRPTNKPLPITQPGHLIAGKTAASSGDSGGKLVDEVRIKAGHPVKQPH